MGQEKGVRRYGAAAARIASWTLLSRVLGLVRDRMMFGFFGRGPEAGAFFLAWTIPNLFRRLFGEGALTAAFIPVLTKRIEADGKEGGRRSLSVVFGALLLLLSVLTLLGWGLALLLPESLLAGGAHEVGEKAEDYAALLRSLLFVLLPYVLPICLMCVAAAAQNVTGRFSLPSAAPVLLNVFWIGGIFACSALELELKSKALLLAGFLLLGGLAQLLLQVPGVMRSGLLARPRFDVRDPDLRSVGKSMLPMVLGLSIVQLNTLAQQVIAAFLVPEVGANSVLFLANRLLEFPFALLGIAMGTAVFPLLALLGNRGEREELRSTLDRALAQALFLAVPATVGLYVLAPQLIEVLFVSGRFTRGDGEETAIVVRVLGLALPGLVVVQVLARAHYALGDTRTPVRVAVTLFFIALGLNLWLAPRYGTAGLAATSVFCATCNGVALWTLLGRKLARSGRRVPLALLRSALASVPCALAAYFSAQFMEAHWPHGASFWARLLFVLLLPTGLGVLGFLLGARLLHAPELAQLKLGRRSK